jgi:hypothetical protein
MTPVIVALYDDFAVDSARTILQSNHPVDFREEHATSN